MALTAALNNGITVKSCLGVIQGHWKWYHSKAAYGFLVALHSNCLVLYHFWGKARYWWKIEIFSYFFYTPSGSPRQNIVITFGVEKLEWCGYLKTKFETQYRLVMDGQTDVRTDILRQHSPLCIASGSEDVCHPFLKLNDDDDKLRSTDSTVNRTFLQAAYKSRT